MSVFENKKKYNISVLKVNSDRMDASISPGFKDHVSGLVAEGVGDLIVDISDVKFMDSSALGAIVSALKLFDGRGKLILVGASGVVLDLFQLTRMDRVLTMFSDYDSAEKSLKEIA